MSTHSLGELVAEELSLAVDPRVVGIAEAIAAQYPGAARAVLFYGSCLRQSELDGLMLDFYLIVSDYEAAYRSRWLATANRALPPNVFAFQHDGMIAKYAVLSEADFLRECGPSAPTVSVWARFAQPSRLVWVSDEEARARAIACVSRAAPTLFGYAVPIADEDEDALAIWRAAFAYTYSCELRAERGGRELGIVDSDPERYRRFGEAVMGRESADPLPRHRAERAWRRFRRRGKALTLARLAKASLTFTGGADYLVWKINRHAGTEIVLKAWQRRWPLLGALTLLPPLLRRGAIR
jgi:hypothetical protein